MKLRSCFTSSFQTTNDLMRSPYERLHALFHDDSMLRRYWGEILRMRFVGVVGNQRSFQVRFSRVPDVGLSFWFIKRRSDWALQLTLSRRGRNGKIQRSRSHYTLDNPVLMFVVIENAHQIAEGIKAR